MSARTLSARSIGHMIGKVGSPASAAEWPTQPISVESHKKGGLEVSGSVLPSSGQVLKQLPPRTALPRKISASGQKRTGEDHQGILEHSPVPFVLGHRPSGGLPFKHGQARLCECVMESPHGTFNMASPCVVHSRD